MIYDVFVIGLGPAGANFCSFIDKDYDVIAVDDRHFADGNFITTKCCGGMLNEDAKKALSEQGLSIGADVLTSPQSFVVKTFDSNIELAKAYRKSYLNIDRDKFDAFIVKQIGKHVDLRFATKFRSYSFENNLFTIKISSGGKTEFIKARHLVDASGSASSVIKKCFKSKFLPARYTAYQRWYKGGNLPNYMLATFDKTITDYYGWGIPKEDGYILGLASNYKGNLNIGFDVMVSNLARFGLEFKDDFKREGSIILRPNKNSQIHLTCGKISFIGEAAGLISTSSSEGISYALRSGRYLAQAMNQNIKDYPRIYEKKVLKLRKMLFVRRLKSPVMYGMSGKPRALVMKLTPDMK